MEIVAGEVVDGKVVVEGGVLREGAKVTVVLETNDELSLSPEQNELLVRSVEQANRGEVVDGWVLLRDLKSIA
mgnify:CR=1 FL=1|jgi:hypothetical protein